MHHPKLVLALVSCFLAFALTEADDKTKGPKVTDKVRLTTNSTVTTTFVSSSTSKVILFRYGLISKSAENPLAGWRLGFLERLFPRLSKTLLSFPRNQSVKAIRAQSFTVSSKIS